MTWQRYVIAVILFCLKAARGQLPLIPIRPPPMLDRQRFARLRVEMILFISAPPSTALSSRLSQRDRTLLPSPGLLSEYRLGRFLFLNPHRQVAPTK
jgi:hypothetical protein